MEDSLFVFNNMVVHNNHQFVYDDVSAVLRTLQQQPFDFSPTETCTSDFNFPVDMAATQRFPFTEAQWRELKRQTMIYKYMMASLPVPPHLLVSADSSFHSPSLFRGVNLRLGANGRDHEPGRCRRTDGKKWRCSRDAVPNQKYCERHMHRGCRPRSRKPVEQFHATNIIDNSQTNKKNRLDLFISADSPAKLPVSDFVVNKNGRFPLLLRQHVSDFSVNKNGPFPLSFNQPDSEIVNADANGNRTVSAYKEARSLEWMKMKEKTSSISTDSCSFHLHDQHHYADQPKNLNLFGTGRYHQGNRGILFMNDSPPSSDHTDGAKWVEFG